MMINLKSQSKEKTKAVVVAKVVVKVVLKEDEDKDEEKDEEKDEDKDEGRLAEKAVDRAEEKVGDKVAVDRVVDKVAEGTAMVEEKDEEEVLIVVMIDDKAVVIEAEEDSAVVDITVIVKTVIVEEDSEVDFAEDSEAAIGKEEKMVGEEATVADSIAIAKEGKMAAEEATVEDSIEIGKQITDEKEVISIVIGVKTVEETGITAERKVVEEVFVEDIEEASIGTGSKDEVSKETGLEIEMVLATETEVMAEKKEDETKAALVEVRYEIIADEGRPENTRVDPVVHNATVP